MNEKQPQEMYDWIINSDTDRLMNLSYPCKCGETHRVPIRYLSIRNGALSEIGHRFDELGVKGKGVIVYDKKIEGSVASSVLPVLKNQGLNLTPHVMGDGIKLIPAEVELAQKMADDIKGKPDYLVSLGSGVISDLTKFAAHLLKLPYVLIPTAPSMNGYTSSMAALTDRGIKSTLMVESAHAIFADTDILKKSPIEMVRSGLGDIVSKSICNADWKLSNIVRKTYFCSLPFHITDISEPLYLDAAEEIGRKTERGISVLTDGIMRSGLSMTIIGTSTPSSGAEHLLSHYLDLMALIKGMKKQFHGVQVGVATLLILNLYEYIRNYSVKNVRIDKLKSLHQDEPEIKRFMKKKFGRYADGVIESYIQKYLPWHEKKKEIEYIIDCWDEIWNELSPYMRPKKPVEHALKRCGAASTYLDLGYTMDDAYDAIINARFIRSRYTILDLAADIGILDEAAGKVVA
ncbi:MAG: iron-containing alcohol dehydrogenase [Spirochaetota bacterium]|nr:MAG: iron-containing alcohol dehydrogenase [Spirochaetota bacterium]